MAASSAAYAYCSSNRAPDAGIYTRGTLEGNWFEERARTEAGEFVQVPMQDSPAARTMVQGSMCAARACKERVGSDPYSCFAIPPQACPR